MSFAPVPSAPHALHPPARGSYQEEATFFSSSGWVHANRLFAAHYSQGSHFSPGIIHSSVSSIPSSVLQALAAPALLWMAQDSCPHGVHVEGAGRAEQPYCANGEGQAEGPPSWAWEVREGSSEPEDKQEVARQTVWSSLERRGSQEDINATSEPTPGPGLSPGHTEAASPPGHVSGHL